VRAFCEFVLDHLHPELKEQVRGVTHYVELGWNVTDKRVGLFATPWAAESFYHFQAGRMSSWTNSDASVAGEEYDGERRAP